MEGVPNCKICNADMRPVKNGFDHINKDGHVRTGDLWGCPKCFSLGLYGVPQSPAMWWPIYGLVLGEMEIDFRYENSPFLMYTNPSFRFFEIFWEYLKEWYPEFYDVWKEQRHTGKFCTRIAQGGEVKFNHDYLKAE